MTLQVRAVRAMTWKVLESTAGARVSKAAVVGISAFGYAYSVCLIGV